MKISTVVSGAVAFARAVANPRQLGEIIKFIDALAQHPAISGPLLEHFRTIEQGRTALRTRPRVGKLDLDELHKMAPGTLGHEFAKHMRANGLDPNALPSRDAKNDEEYLSAHFYETHDIWHVLTGFATDDAGEAGLTTFVLAQAPARVPLGLMTMGLSNTVLKEFDQYPVRLRSMARGWLLGRRARPLFGVDWKTLWSEPLSDLRARFDLDVEGIDRVMAEWDGGQKSALDGTRASGSINAQA